MGLKKLAAKMADYNARLDEGKTEEIKPSHVEKVLGKLRDKETELTERLAQTENLDKSDRLNRKIGIAREHINRAEWLLDHLG